MRRLTLSQAKRRTCPLYYVCRSGERVQVASWRKWAKDVLLTTSDGREFVVSRSTLLETGDK